MGVTCTLREGRSQAPRPCSVSSDAKGLRLRHGTAHDTNGVHIIDLNGADDPDSTRADGTRGAALGGAMGRLRRASISMPLDG